MKRKVRVLVTASFAITLTIALFASQSTVEATQSTEAQQVIPAQVPPAPVDQKVDELPIGQPEAFPAKRCSTSSDCPNSKCRSGKCGACSTSSDCKYGKCRSSRCGGCSTSSDCGGWGKCKSSRCGGCSTSSDCGRFGSCRSGRCSKTPY